MCGGILLRAGGKENRFRGRRRDILHGARGTTINMATAVHDSTLQNITSTTSFQTSAAESPLRSKSCGPDVGRDPGTKDDTASFSTVSVKGDTKSTTETGVAVSESKSATAVTSTKTKIFDNKIFVEAPIPKTNPWLKSSLDSVGSTKGENAYINVRDDSSFLGAICTHFCHKSTVPSQQREHIW